MKSLMMMAQLFALSAAATLPKRMSGFYCLVADDTVANYTSTDNWQPNLYDYQQEGANTVFLTFVNPKLMPAVPPAMQNLAKCRGETGCPKKDVPLIVAVGGQAYSTHAWEFLATQQSAEAMAVEVAKWADMGFDGIDLDIEGGAGAGKAGPNMEAFVKKLRSLKPDFIITQPVYGYPQVAAESWMVNNGWALDNKTGEWKSTGQIDTVGIMVYSGLNSLDWVKNYAHGTKQWQGFPIHVDVPTNKVIAGMGGDAGDKTITDMAKAVVAKDLGGLMVWSASLFDKTNNRAAFHYGNGFADASSHKSAAWAQAVKIMNQ